MKGSGAKVDVLIVGAGPSGLALAAELERLGVSGRIVDRQPAGANTSRAAVIHARTLEVLEPLGVTAQLLDEGVKVPIFRVRDRDRSLATIDFAGIDSAYPFTLMCPQDRTERLLLARLRQLGGHVERPAEFVAFESLGTSVAATIATDEHRQSVECRWLVGCDGMHSRIREQAGIPFHGAAYAQGFVLADVRMDWPFGRDEVNLFFSPQGLAVVAPLPEGRYRVVATDDSAPETPSLEYVQTLLDARGPTVEPGRVHDIVWSSRFRIHHRVAESPRNGRVLLCGDAAHVHSPAGGQGMNTGIQDAISLARVLADTVHDGDESRLDDWAASRHRIAADVVSMTHRMTAMATMKSPLGQSLRNAAIAFAGHIPPIRGAIARNLAELDAR
jgi:2-polyprenyl-6-methoxyphenol hydroxylase-like FAD-dependent oxidoreductase